MTGAIAGGASLGGVLAAAQDKHSGKADRSRHATA